ncbi:Hexuronate transporter [Paraliobacillus sp. PM-2]|uniref:MFS transporter n=1 Tax=Paraliobacillus sp. PM-2 TaxID=1462524 RepID=UPI00061C0F20|nr:MFS transporter [Paraliobacillus sp. PM-2]CQR45905.1 Hexuronate transporter [Paraliobacillus sp. PM-2]
MNYTQQQWKIAFTLFLIGTLVYIDKNLISITILALGQEFDWDTSQTGIILSLYYIGFILITLPGGWFVDHFGYKRFIVIALSIVVISSILFSFGTSLWLLAIIRIGIGAGHAGYTNGSPKVISENFEGKQRTALQSKILATSGIGGLIAYTGGIKVIGINWRSAYLLLAILAVLALISLILFVPDKKPEKKEVFLSRASIFIACRNKSVLIISIGMFFVNLVTVGLMSWLPAVLKTNFSVSNTQLGEYLTINSIVMSAAAMSAGFIIMKFFANYEKQFIAIFSTIGAISLIVFIYSTHIIAAITLLFLITVFSMFVFTAFLIVPYKIIPSVIIGSSYAAINIGAFIGGSVSPLIIGNLITISGGSFKLAFIIMAVCLLLAGVSAILLQIDIDVGENVN